MTDAETKTEAGTTPARRIAGILGLVLSAGALLYILWAADLVALGQSLRNTSPWAIACALTLLLLRDAGSDIASWQATLSWSGHPVRFVPLLRVWIDYVVIKLVFPAGVGDAARVVTLSSRHGVPLVWATASRMVAQGLRLAATLGALGLFAAWALQGLWPLLLLMFPLGALTVITWRRMARSFEVASGSPGRETVARLWRGWPQGVRAGGYAVLCVALSLGAYSLILFTTARVAPSPAMLAVVAMTLLACHVTFSARGIGVREVVLTWAASNLGLGNSEALLGAALILSGVELVLVLALGGLSLLDRAWR